MVVPLYYRNVRISCMHKQKVVALMDTFLL
jgi:hypothetical protein